MSENLRLIDGPIKKRGSESYLAWAGFLVGVLGLITAYFYYEKSLTYPAISWWATNQIAFSAQNTSANLRLIDRNGSPIDGDVFALNMSVSNTGTSLLEHVDDINSLVRTPLIISYAAVMKNKARLMSASIVAVSTPEPTRLGCRASNGAISIDWGHFDPGNGFRLLLLYTSPHEIDLEPTISVAGMDHLRHIILSPETEPKAMKTYWDAFAPVLVIPVMLSVSLLGYLSVKGFRFLAGRFSWLANCTRAATKFMEPWLFQFIPLATIIIMAFVLYQNYMEVESTKPPVAIATTSASTPCQGI